MDAAFDGDAFTALQSRLAPLWGALTLRGETDGRTLVVVSSVSIDVPADYLPLLPAYEERYLIYVLALASDPRTRVIYLTSQPVLPRMLDHYLGLIPGLDDEDVHRRLIPVSVGDWTQRPLTQKILERPRLLHRLRSLIGEPAQAVILPFVTTQLEARLAIELGVPIYGADPRLEAIGSKTGSREVFASAGVPHPRGAAGVHTVSDVVEVLAQLRSGPNPPDGVVVKHDVGVSGGGNAMVDLRDAESGDRADLAARVQCLRPEDPNLDVEAYLEQLDREGGVVEERIVGEHFCSPSVQLRASPEGGIEVLTTHDQVLGGESGQTYYGCRFPAAPAYAPVIADHAVAIAGELSRQGVVGRFGVDFVVTRQADGWSPHAVEINLRSGGTTHPYLALLALTNGTYDPASARFLADGVAKHYVASDHIETERLDRLTPDDVLDVIAEADLGWDHDSGTGCVPHMVSGVGVAGRIGVTAIADSPRGAADRLNAVETALTEAAG